MRGVSDIKSLSISEPEIISQSLEALALIKSVNYPAKQSET